MRLQSAHVRKIHHVLAMHAYELGAIESRMNRLQRQRDEVSPSSRVDRGIIRVRFHAHDTRDGDCDNCPAVADEELIERLVPPQQRRHALRYGGVSVPAVTTPHSRPVERRREPLLPERV